MGERVVLSWRTTLAGIASIGCGVSLLVVSACQGNAGIEMATIGSGLISTGIGLLLSKDV